MSDLVCDDAFEIRSVQFNQEAWAHRDPHHSRRRRVDGEAAGHVIAANELDVTVDAGVLE